jgi:hypothetical protein
MTVIPTLHHTLCTAIAERRLVSFSSKRCSRIAEPHDYGVVGGVRKLLYYQVGGRSNSDPPTGWRWAEIAEMSGVQLLEQQFPGPRAAPSGRHVKWDEIFASISERG